MPPFPCRAVLFDLDGTLIDSAPDLAGAANELRAERGLPPLPLAELRPWVGAGARGMLGASLHLKPGDAEFDAMRDRFLALYEARLLKLTAPFEGVPELVDAIEGRGFAWGIVTNKAERFTLPIHRGLPLLKRSGAVVAGDTTPRAKPHPDPLLEAARRLALEAADCIYVGDDERDVQAAKAAGMPSVVARWGYLGAGDVAAWEADAVIERPADLLELIRGT